MKEQIIQEIFTHLESIGLAPSKDAESDIVVDKELLDAKVGSGETMIHYENAILIDEGDKTVLLYEKTSQKGKGFAFGSSSESSYQSGKILARHVKGAFVGINGAQVHYDFDVGEISKSIKEISEKNGYKFKTVIRRKSAQTH